MPVLTYIDAISRGMWEEMERDPAVFLIGEDIGAYGGAFKATKRFPGAFRPGAGHRQRAF
jgi:pyruvate/2-oxoglutarate/acetoin dehydrogenase E1 component